MRPSICLWSIICSGVSVSRARGILVIADDLAVVVDLPALSPGRAGIVDNFDLPAADQKAVLNPETVLRNVN